MGVLYNAFQSPSSCCSLCVSAILDPSSLAPAVHMSCILSVPSIATLHVFLEIQFFTVLCIYVVALESFSDFPDSCCGSSCQVRLEFYRFHVFIHLLQEQVLWRDRMFVSCQALVLISRSLLFMDRRASTFVCSKCIAQGTFGHIIKFLMQICSCNDTAHNSNAGASSNRQTACVMTFVQLERRI